MEQMPAKECQTDWAANRRLVWLWPAAFALALAGWLIVGGTSGDVLAVVGFAAAGLLCVGNAMHCRRVHCAFTGPLYLIAAALFVARLAGLGISPALIIALALAGSVAAFVPEWWGRRYFRRAACGGTER